MAIERSTMLGAIPDPQVASSSFYNEPDKTGRAWFSEFDKNLMKTERAWFVTLKPYELDQFFAECDNKFKEPQRISYPRHSTDQCQNWRSTQRNYQKLYVLPPLPFVGSKQGMILPFTSSGKRKYVQLD